MTSLPGPMDRSTSPIPASGSTPVVGCRTRDRTRSSRSRRGSRRVAIKNDSTLKNPNGIAWDGANGRFVLGPFNDKAVSGWKDGDSTLTQIASGPGGYDGVEVLADGRILVTSWSDSAVHVISNGTFRKVVANVEAPADIAIDTKRNVLALPRFNAGRVEYFTIAP